MEELEFCPVCKSKKNQTLFNCKDYVSTGESFQIVKCQDCTHQFTNPRPKEAEVSKYYQSDKYISHAGNEKSKHGLTYFLYDVIRNYSINRKLRLIKKHQTNGKLLDLGCGLGYFLNGTKHDGTFEAYGSDISKEAIDYVKKQFQIEVKNEDSLKDFNKGEFDVITQWHVLEHVYKIDERLQELKYLLNQKGTMFIAVPNSSSWDAKHYKQQWDGYDVPRHIHHFNPTSLKLLLNKAGFSIKEELTLWFDAPYISMRSEYHKGNSKLGFILGGLKGIYSNLRSITTRNPSTILFVVEHTK